MAALKPGLGQPNISFVIETHSEAHRLGEFISLGVLDREKVSVNLFQAQQVLDGKTSVSTSEFGPDGAPLDWPFGFFQPEALV